MYLKFRPIVEINSSIPCTNFWIKNGGGLWWLVMAVGGWWWLIMAGGGWWWFIMAGDGWWWLVVALFIKALI